MERVSEVYSVTQVIPTLYKIAFVFRKAGSVLLNRLVPAIRFTPLHSVPAAIGFILQGLPKFYMAGCSKTSEVSGKGAHI